MGLILAMTTMLHSVAAKSLRSAEKGQRDGLRFVCDLHATRCPLATGGRDLACH